jgi:hypothetical protein
MYYKIVERFGPEHKDKWQSYIQWRGLDLTAFDSVDGILRPDLFMPESKEDWDNCVNEDNKLNLITNLDYARKILGRYEDSVIVGVEIELEEGYGPEDGFLGYDIIDGYCDISLVTNWGTDEEDLLSEHVMTNGLIGDLNRALQIRDTLRKEFPEDAHAENCEVWAVYRVDV